MMARQRKRASQPLHHQSGLRRVLALGCWVYGGWVLLTWTLTWSQLLFGLGFALIIALALAPLGEVAEPWRLLRPLRALGFTVLLGDALFRVVRANCSLARRIWVPSRPIRSGMIVVPTAMRSEGGLSAVGIITSVIVDNQIVDLDVAHHELQYHAIWVDSDEPEENRGHVNGPIEERLRSAGLR